MTSNSPIHKLSHSHSHPRTPRTSGELNPEVPATPTPAKPNGGQLSPKALPRLQTHEQNGCCCATKFWVISRAAKAPGTARFVDETSETWRVRATFLSTEQSPSWWAPGRDLTLSC